MNSACEVNSTSPLRVHLLYLSVVVGAFCFSLLTAFFLYKWHIDLAEEQKQQLIPRLTWLVIMLMCYERIARVFEVYLNFNSPRMTAAVFYHITNFISTFGQYGSLTALLTVKLVKTFKDTVFEVPKQEVHILIGLIITDLLCVYSQFILRVIPAVRYSLIGKAILYADVVSIMIISCILLAKLNIGFVRRLKILVAENVADQSEELAEIGDVSLSPKEVCSPTVTIEMDASEIHKQLSHQTLNSFEGLRRSSVKDYRFDHQQILMTAAKSTVIALWISVSFIFLFIATILFVKGQCQSWSNIIGRSCRVCAIFIVGSALTLSLPNTREEYDLICSKCDLGIQHVVAWQTAIAVSKIQRKSHSHPHAQKI